MKYKKKSIICTLLAGLTVLISSCHHNKPGLSLLATKQINFPSASAIEFYDNKLYVFGDDAAYLLQLTSDYQVIDSFFFWERVMGRIPKKDKHDIESAFISNANGRLLLYGVASMSTTNRTKIFSYDLQTETIKDTSFFPAGTTFPFIKALNLEGSCMVNQGIVLANRANLSNPMNHLIFLDGKGGMQVKELLLPNEKTISGVSGLYYVKEKDMLLFTASEEETASTTSDGAIGNSYIGWITSFASKMNESNFTPDKFISLTEYDDIFRKQKVESICVERVEGNNLTIHLAADNDDGTSMFFKLSLLL